MLRFRGYRSIRVSVTICKKVQTGFQVKKKLFKRGVNWLKQKVEYGLRFRFTINGDKFSCSN